MDRNKMIEETQSLNWKSSPWLKENCFNAFRHGRFIIVELRGDHRVLTTSACNGGMTGGVTHLVNHQSCEGTGHVERYEEIKKLGTEGYHTAICAELDLNPTATAVMGTAAN